MKKLPCYCMILFALLKSAQYLKYWRFPENRFLWTLFPDTVLWTIGYFALCLCAVGLMNVRMIRKTKIKRTST